MPPSYSQGHHSFLPSSTAALEELEECTGRPVMIVEDPSLNVLATISRAGPGQGSHILRIKEGSGAIPDYLIAFECRMALRDEPDETGQRLVIADRPLAKESVIGEVERLHSNLPPPKAQELGSFMVHGLLVQLRSMGPGLQVDGWIREHCPDLREAQEEFISEQINSNLGGLQAGSRANFPARVYDASIAMNAAYAVFGGDLLGKPHLGVPYSSAGHGPIARRLISIALRMGPEGKGASDRQIIDGWARELGLEGWYDWTPMAV
jgi:hypothetical protein